jgi:hypothetical protein
MAIISCKECKKEVSSEAATCPHCGVNIRKAPTQYGCGTLILLLVVAAVVMSAIGSFQDNRKKAEEARVAAQHEAAKTPEQREKDRAAKEAADADKRRKDEAITRGVAGSGVLKKNMRNPQSFSLSSAIVIDGTGAACYEYRSQNGFGGMNQGRAALSADGKAFLTSEMPGFSKLWNKECANKSGQSIKAAIEMFGR